MAGVTLAEVRHNEGGMAKGAYEGIESRVDDITARAIEVIGDRDEALRWLGTPVRALGYATPISLLKDEAGAKEVLDVLAALEQGSW